MLWCACGGRGGTPIELEAGALGREGCIRGHRSLGLALLPCLAVLAVCSLLGGDQGHAGA